MQNVKERCEILCGDPETPRFGRFPFIDSQMPSIPPFPVRVPVAFAVKGMPRSPVPTKATRVPDVE